jgi:hypothetical protein
MSPLAGNSAFIILWNDLVQLATVTASSESGTSPAANLADTDRQTQWAAGTTGDAWVRAYRATAMSACGYSIHNHNLQTAGVTSVIWQGSNDGSTWTNLVTNAIADIGDNDFFSYYTGTYKYFRLYMVGATSAPKIGRLFVPDNSWLLHVSIRPPLEGSAGGIVMRNDRFETLAGLEHTYMRGLARRRRTWILNHLDNNAQLYLDAFQADAYQSGKTFVISDPEGSVGSTTWGYGKAIHVRNAADELLSQYQSPAFKAVTLDFIEVL